MTPKTDDEWLYLGLALTWTDPFAALKALDRATEFRPLSPIVRLARSKALLGCALDTVDPEEPMLAASEQTLAASATGLRWKPPLREDRQFLTA